MNKISFLVAMLLSACATGSQPAAKPSPGPTASAISLSFATQSCSQTLRAQQASDAPVATWLDASTLQVQAKVSANCAVTIKQGRYELAGSQLRLYYTPEACGVPGGPTCVRCTCDHPVTYTLRNLSKREYTITLTNEATP